VGLRSLKKGWRVTREEEEEEEEEEVYISGDPGFRMGYFSSVLVGKFKVFR